MNCVKCGYDIPDGSIFCPSCGTKQTVQESAAPASAPVSPVIAASPVVSAAPVQSTASAAPSGTGSAQSKSSGNIGGFFSAYFKNPIKAVSDHAKDEFWLWGLIILGAYAFLMFLIGFRGAFDYGGIYFLRHTVLWFVFMITDMIKFATLIFALFLFQGIFKVNKKSLKSLVALTGLSFLPLIAADLLGNLFSGIFLLNNLVSGLSTAAFVFAAILIFLDYKKDTEEKTGLKPLLLTVVSFICMPIIASVFNGIAWWIYSKAF